MSKFWELRPLENTKGYGKPVEWFDSEAGFERVYCPVHKGHQKPGKRIGDLSIIIKGSMLGDILWTWLGECLIQDHVFTMFQEQNFTGFDVLPVEKVFLGKNIKFDVPKLYEVIVTGWAGDAPKQSGVKLVDYCPYCGSAKFSEPSSPEFLIDEKQWDGNDFFMVWPLPGYIFVTSRVADFLKIKRLRGYQVIPVDKLSFEGSGLSPGAPPANRCHQRFLYQNDGKILNWKEVLEKY